MKKPLVINLIGAPGAGKSTISSRMFSDMKTDGLDVEIAPEYAKELVWEGRTETFKDELYLFAKQNHRMFRLNGKTDYIITDGDKNEAFKNIVLHEAAKYNNKYIFLDRTKPYKTSGRNETEEQSNAFSLKIKDMLIDLRIPFEVRSSTDTIDYKDFIS
jgi:predicted ATPase